MLPLTATSVALLVYSTNLVGTTKEVDDGEARNKENSD